MTSPTSPNGQTGNSQTALQTAANQTLDLNPINLMYSYAQTIGNLSVPQNAPHVAPNPERPELNDITVEGVLATAKEHAGQWQDKVKSLNQVAGHIRNYCEDSKEGIALLREDSGNPVDKDTYDKLPPDQKKLVDDSKVLTKDGFDALSSDQKQQLKEDFIEVVKDMKAGALTNQKLAEAQRDDLLSYAKLIKIDGAQANLVEQKYQEWICKEQTVLENWEREQGFAVGETDAQLQAIQDDIDKLRREYAGLVTGATVSGILIVFLPVGLLFMGGCIAMSIEAEEWRKKADAIQERLNELKTFNAVGAFFTQQKKQLDGLADQCSKAAQALGELAGTWQVIIDDLTALDESGGKLDAFGDYGVWDEPLSTLKARSATRIYDEIIAKAKNFEQLSYVEPPVPSTTGTH